MTILAFSCLLGLSSAAAGFFGALTGLGGGIVIVPLLTLVFGVDIRYAAGASLVSVIATSSGAAAAYVREGYTNVRLGVLLEVATTVGALVGAYLAAHASGVGIRVLFGLVLIFSAVLSPGTAKEEHAAAERNLAARLRLGGTYPTPSGTRCYEPRAVPLGFGLMFGAGALSGLLGIGSGAFKVLAMDRTMRLPFKVSTTTSNFMIGVTAAASAGIYLSNGYIEPGLAMPVMLGVLAGASLGARVLAKTRTAKLRLVFSAVLLFLGFQMIYQALLGRG